MYYLQVKDLSHSFGHRVILSHIDFSIQKGQKVALLARNGSGKSTFLKLLMGELECSHGDIIRNNAIRVGFLAQEEFVDPEITVQGYFEQQTLSDDHDESRQHLVKVKKIITKLKLSHHLDQKLGSLSGGERKRVSLAKVLMDEPNMLILDEPTNHLDLDMIERLEKFLRKSAMTLLMVTHDRYFLERVCSDIVELERGKLHHYSGNYSKFLFKKAERVEKEMRDTHIMKQLYRRELDRVRKAPQGRGKKSVAREKDFYNLQDEYGEKKQQLKENSVKIDISAAAAPRLGTKVMVVAKLCKSFPSHHAEVSKHPGEKELGLTGPFVPQGDTTQKIILDNFSHSFRQGERIGIIGKNGVGKSTFVDILMEYTQIDKGTIEKADNLRLGYFSQQHQFTQHEKVIDLAKSVADFIMIGKERISTTKLLERFLFTPAQQQTDVISLSGGEKRRLHLLMVLMSNPNFLILDEPTNDLDIATLTALEDFLLSYAGCLIVISHDRFFIDKIAERMFYFAGHGKIVDFQGGYTAFRARQDKQLSDKKKNKNQTGVVPEIVLRHDATEETIIPAKKNLTYNEKREFEQLVIDIAAGETKKDEINLRFQTEQLDHHQIKLLGKELHDLSESLRIKEERWFELAEYIG